MIPLRNKQVETWWVDNQYLSEDVHVTIYSFLKDQHERTTFFKLSGEIVARPRAKMGLL